LFGSCLKIKKDTYYGSTAGALVVTVDKEGYWKTDLAGQAMYDREILSQIAFRLLGVCMATE
jgi:hypothetical protein